MPTEAQITQILESGAIGVAVLLGIAVVILALAFSKVVDFLSGFFKQLIEINSNLAEQARLTRVAVDANAEADKAHTVSIDKNTDAVKALGTQITGVDTHITTGFDQTHGKLDQLASVVTPTMEMIKEVRLSVNEVLKEVKEMADKKGEILDQVNALSSKLDTAERKVLEAIASVQQPQATAKTTQTLSVVSAVPQSVTGVTPPIDKDETISDRKNLEEKKS